MPTISMFYGLNRAIGDAGAYSNGREDTWLTRFPGHDLPGFRDQPAVLAIVHQRPTQK